MAGKLLITISAFLLVQFSYGRVIRDAPTETNSLNEMFTKAGEALKVFEQNFFGFVGIKDEAEFKNVLETQSKMFVSKLDKLSEDIKIQADTIGNSDTVKNLRVSVDEAINSWKSQNPSTAQDFDKFKEQISKTSQNLIKDMGAFGDSDAGKKFKDLSAQVLESTADALNNVSKSIQNNQKQL